MTPNAPFTELIQEFGTLAESSPVAQIDSSLQTDDKDIVLQKTRWYAGAGNSLEQLLRARGVDTVIIVSNLPWPSAGWPIPETDSTPEWLELV